MRKADQKKILESLHIINDIIHDIRKLIGAKKTDDILQSFVNISTLLLAIEEFINESIGEGAATARELDDFQTVLFQMHENLIETKQPNGLILKNLRNFLDRARDSVLRELKPDRIEIVFIASRPSTFDSMESVYNAAKSDPSCNAYVIPLNFSGEPHIKTHEHFYQKNGIKIISIEDYDIETRRPDAVFIDYPYDEFALEYAKGSLTFCEYLSKHCEMLVHIPYFGSFYNRFPGNSTYTQMSGVLFSHRVILQSEEMRQAAIREYTQNDKKYGWRGRFGNAGKKFVALGSPKLDKLMSATHKDYEIPEDWKKIIYRADGTRKKVILLSTHYFTFIKNCQAYLKKMESVYDLFVQHSNDAVLWWRPHPNMVYAKDALDLLEGYKSFVNKCIGQGAMIYDDSPNLHRALGWSDAFYGEWSSLITLFFAAEKPVMIMNPYHISSNIINYIPTWFYVSQDSIWFMLRRYNALLKMNKKDWVPELVTSFPVTESEYEERRLCGIFYGYPAEKDGVLYFPPGTSDVAVCYSIHDNSFNKLDSFSNKELRERAFHCSVYHNGYIYFAPNRYRSILRLNVETKELTFYSDWVHKIEGLPVDTEELLFTNPILIGDSIWQVAYFANLMIEFDTTTCTSTIHEVGPKHYRYRNITHDGECFWISPRVDVNTPIVKWNPCTGEVKEFPELKNIMVKDDYLHGIYCEGYIWLIPYKANTAYKIDKLTGNVTEAKEFNVELLQDEGNEKNIKYSLATVFGNSIYAFNEQNGNLIEYNCTTKERREEILNFPKEMRKQLSRLSPLEFTAVDEKANKTQNPLLHENNINSLDKFINFIENYKFSKKQPTGKTENTTYGKTIYEYIKNMILA